MFWRVVFVFVFHFSEECKMFLFSCTCLLGGRAAMTELPVWGWVQAITSDRGAGVTALTSQGGISGGHSKWLKTRKDLRKMLLRLFPQSALPCILSLCCELGVSSELSGWSRKEIFVRDFKNVLLFQIGSSWGSYMSVSVTVPWCRLSDLQLFSISFQERMPEWNCSSVTHL